MGRVARSSQWAGAALVLALGVGLSPSAAAQQEEWKWPEKAENLTVLPADFPAGNLRAVMSGFTRSLGSGCSHCHVGVVGQPLTTYDFVSDDNPNKERAREMLRMLQSVNDHLKKITPSEAERVNMWCHTCHRGRPRPTTLAEELRLAHADGGAEAAVARYRELREEFYGRGTLDFGERSLNSYGYELAGEGDLDGAIAILRLNAEQFPGSANVWDSLGEAYLRAGRKEQAAIYYRKSLEIDPENDNALDKLREIAGEGG